jgi:two-component system OmpR family response regulator
MRCDTSREMNVMSPIRDADLLIVDDDDELRAEMAAYLRGHGYIVHEAAEARTARRILKASPIQVVVLDVMMPGEDGLSLCRSLADDPGPAVLMLSAMGESIDRVLGLELGADDYVVKPLEPRELLARVRALLRRRQAHGAGRGRIYGFAGFRFDIVRRRLSAPDGVMLMLTPGELSLLGAFIDNPRAVLTRDELFILTRGETSPHAVDRAIDVQVSRLRRKLNDKAESEIIKTYRGLGYVFDAEVTAL